MNMTQIENARSILRQAVDRQQRAETSEEWLADQAVINREADYLAMNGCDRAAELERART